MFGGYAPLPLRLGGSSTNGLTAAQHARLCADMVALVRQAELAHIGLTTGQTGIRHYQAQWETGVANAPTITIGASGAGWVRATWEAGYRDPFGAYRALSITDATVNVASLAIARASYIIEAPNVVTIYTTAPNGFLLDDIPVFLVVY